MNNNNNIKKKKEEKYQCRGDVAQIGEQDDSKQPHCLAGKSILSSLMAKSKAFIQKGIRIVMKITVDDVFIH